MDCTRHDNRHLLWPGGTSSHVGALLCCSGQSLFTKGARHHATEGITYRVPSRDDTEVDGVSLFTTEQGGQFEQMCQHCPYLDYSALRIAKLPTGALLMMSSQSLSQCSIRAVSNMVSRVFLRPDPTPSAPETMAATRVAYHLAGVLQYSQPCKMNIRPVPLIQTPSQLLHCSSVDQNHP